MSYEKINDLIEQAPDVSQWWLSNKRALTWWYIFMRIAIVPAFAIPLFSIMACLMVYLSWGMHAESLGDAKWWLIGTPLASVGGLAFLRSFINYTPKRFKHKGLVLEILESDEAVSLAFVHKILSRAVNISDPQMKPILARLHALKDTDLPKCWWDALACEVDKCIVTPHPVNESMQEQLNAVYIQMEDVAASPTPSKVLRL